MKATLQNLQSGSTSSTSSEDHTLNTRISRARHSRKGHCQVLKEHAKKDVEDQDEGKDIETPAMKGKKGNS